MLSLKLHSVDEASLNDETRLVKLLVLGNRGHKFNVKLYNYETQLPLRSIAGAETNSP